MAKGPKPRKNSRGNPKQNENSVENSRKGRKAEKNPGTFAESITTLLGSPKKQPSVRIPLSEIVPPPRLAKPVTGKSSLAPRKVFPGLIQDSRCRDPNWLLKDQRPALPAVFLPNESEVQRALRFERKGHFPFLKLPGEIRNKIYDHLIPETRFAIDWVHGTQKSRSLTYSLPDKVKFCQPCLRPDVLQRRLKTRTNKKSSKAEHRATMNELYERASPVALLWVCKAMYPEASSIFYSKAQFTFSFLGPLRHFLKTTSSSNKAVITHINLQYCAYGHPGKTADQIWKSKHDRLWTKLCWRLTDELTSLSHLALDLDYNTGPMLFGDLDSASASLGSQWMQPLQAFMDIGIVRCWCRVRCASKESAVLEVASWNVRKQILGEKWDEEAEGGRDAFGYEKGVLRSKKKSLVLTLDMSGGNVFRGQ